MGCHVWDVPVASSSYSHLLFRVCCPFTRLSLPLHHRGVLNIVHGTHDTVNRILDHPDIAAVSFVGGDRAGRYIYERAAANGKRVQVGS